MEFKKSCKNVGVRVILRKDIDEIYQVHVSFDA